MTHLRGDEQTLLVAGHQDFCPPLLQVLTYGRVQEEDDDLFDDPLGARGRGVALGMVTTKKGCAARHRVRRVRHHGTLELPSRAVDAHFADQQIAVVACRHGAVQFVQVRRGEDADNVRAPQRA